MRNSIVSLAAITALILFWLGIRNLKIQQNRKAGLFLSTIMIVLSLLGYRQAGALDQDNSSKKMSITKSAEKYAIKLVKKPGWKDFRAFWKKLDEITPDRNKVKNEKDLSYLEEYSGAISSEEVNKIQQELKALIGNLKKYEQNGIANPLVIGLLERICLERLKYMSFGFSSMKTRMIPSPSLIAQENSIRDLERNIDGLVLLRKKGKVSKDEFRQALANIQENIRAFSMLDTIGRYYVRYYNLAFVNETKKKFTVEDYMADFERHYADYQKRKQEGTLGESDKYYKDLDSKYQETKQALERLKPVLSIMNELIADLEQ